MIKKERIKRDVIKSLSRMLFKGSTLTVLTMDEQKFEAQFECSDKEVSTRLKALAKEENFMTTAMGTEHNLKIEGRL
ncbi:MAG: hypothetical protein Q9M36_15820 [Sulfurovum sp.]|nr:hypothetical protein [Sulfurovum sp.]